ncbi:G-type lectin S-receptor-like serine/threonine-protein kinase RLK1 [Apium graveolens]|uniref:G-type lectin S-receptor-like serine/threonine-protein kinase RLK1 n=1 Tax=Apium graveolens TaxID=4045 RepID=UPI003D79CB1E
MGYTSLYVLCMFLFVWPYSGLAQGNGTISVSSFLTAADQATLWYSPSGDFAFGFRKVQDQFLLSIWYDKIPDKTIVWFVNDGTTVPAGSKVQLTTDRGLVLTDTQGKELWRSEPLSGTASRGVFNDTGNFMIFGSSWTKLWDSFSNPIDTLLPAQTMEVNGTLNSRLTETNFTKGKFQLRLLENGNLVLNSRDILTDHVYGAYYRSQTNDINPSNQGYQVKYSTAGYMYIAKRNGDIVNLTTNGAIPSTGYYHRATLTFDGVLVQYYHPKDSTGTSKWISVWQIPVNICLDVRGDTGSGACGFNSVCRLDEARRADCECPESYSLLDPNDTHGSCKPNFAQNCDDNGSSEKLYDLVEITDTDWPFSDYEQLKPISEIECRRHCLNDCFCAVAIYRGDSCWKKKLPLSKGRKDRAVNGKAFLKFSKGDLPPEHRRGGDNPIYPEKNDKRTLIVVFSVLLGSSVFVNFILIAVVGFGFSYIYHKKKKNSQHANDSVETNVCRFTNKELVEATNGFKQQLGRGSFGIVYKGVIQMSSTVIVAVKKIDSLAQDGAREFKTEVNVIAQTHHKNLVRLVGFCEEEQHRLLVYEYMVNGTLASLIFSREKPSWALRNHIALGIAGGLAYLHEECSTQIIHCDIKPQNILLDEYYNARISDFGLAKLLMLNQSRTSTGIRGTKGYVAPEWFRNIPITVKVDVYSFGVLLLEIICCRRSVENLEFGEKAILTDWVWDCFQDGRMIELLENDEDILSEWEKVETFVIVGIWCIQEDPSLRPTMRKVIQMLEGVVHVPDPPCPSPFRSTST